MPLNLPPSVFTQSHKGDYLVPRAPRRDRPTPPACRRIRRPPRPAVPGGTRPRDWASSGRAPSRSCTEAAVTITYNTSPNVLTAMWRLRPLIFFPASSTQRRSRQPRPSASPVGATCSNVEHHHYLVLGGLLVYGLPELTRPSLARSQTTANMTFSVR
jgi:hypothetical protein